MSSFSRLASVSVASAAAVGLIIPIVVTSPASADPCAQTVNAATPNIAAAPRATGPVEHAPTGRKPAGAQDQAPPPTLGPLPAAGQGSTAGTQPSAPLQNQAAVIPVPTPPGAPQQPAPNAAQSGPNTAAGPAAPAPAGPAPGRAAVAAAPSTSVAGWLNGPSSPNNTLPRFGISGADLGIIWDNGDPGNDQILIAFGDTFGDCTVPGQEWRSNTLFRSADNTLADGIYVPDAENPLARNNYAGSPVADRPNFSKQIINSLNLVPTEVTIIPTAAIAVGTTQYVNFMSVRQWGNPGQWTTNFSAIAVSTDNGEKWSVNRSTIRPSWFFSVPSVWFLWGNQNFQQGAFVRRGGYVYSFGTPSGRGGSAYVSRVPEDSVQDLTKYEYWSQPWWSFGNGSWAKNNPSAATAVISAPVSEMSVQWNDYLSKYIALYTDVFNNVVMRTAGAPEGPWSSPQTLVTSAQIPGGIYAPFMHPWSTGKDLYFNLSLWSAYSVMVMHTVLP